MTQLAYFTASDLVHGAFQRQTPEIALTMTFHCCRLSRHASLKCGLSPPGSESGVLIIPVASLPFSFMPVSSDPLSPSVPSDESWEVMRNLYLTMIIVSC